jgi:hypothetical protein
MSAVYQIIPVNRICTGSSAITLEIKYADVEYAPLRISLLTITFSPGNTSNRINRGLNDYRAKCVNMSGLAQNA